MAVLEMLTEMVGTEEFLGLVALAEFVCAVQMASALLPVGRWLIGELETAVAAGIVCRWHRLGLTREVLRGWELGGREESGGVILSENCAGPGMSTEVEGVFMTLGFVLVLETIRAVCATMLLFRFMLSENELAVIHDVVIRCNKLTFSPPQWQIF